jgi:hypothetical protein
VELGERVEHLQDDRAEAPPRHRAHGGDLGERLAGDQLEDDEGGAVTALAVVVRAQQVRVDDAGRERPSCPK